jgi:hypothetical protein
MTTHLSAPEFVDAIEGGLTADRQRHLDVCAACQTEVETLRTIVVDLDSDADLPEPSPLFWEHFQSRVNAAVREEAMVPSRAEWWRTLPGAGAMRTWLTAGATVAALVMVTAMYLRAPVDAGRPVDAGAALAETVVPDEAALVLGGAEWEFVSGMLETLQEDDMRRVLTPSRNAVDAAMGNLSESERKTFLRLLQAEMVAGME